MPVEATSWRMWWAFNKDPYLQLKRAVHDGGVSTGGEGYFIGQPARLPEPVDLAPSAAEVEQRVLPALRAALQDDPSADVLRELLLALARAGRDGALAADEELTGVAIEHLRHSNHAVLEAAVVALGLSGDFEAVELLSHLLHGCPAGCEAVGRGAVPRRVRALAAYALGLAGARAEVPDVRRFIVRHLALTLDSERVQQREVRVACITALGLTPLALDGRDYDDARAELDHGGTSRETQLAYLLWYLREDGFDDITRAHVPTAIARLSDGLDPEWKALLVDQLRARLSKASKEPREVRQSCALALGAIADADGDAADVRARKALEKAVGDADLSTRYFALIGLAQAGGRPGQGDAEEATAGTAAVRKYLLHQLARGKSTTRPWAGLALGVLGRSLVDAGRMPSEDASAALIATLASCRSPDRAGAYALALGLRKDGQARGLLEEKLELFGGDEVACGELAVALGMLDAGAAGETLWEVARGAKRRPHLLAESSIGLALLGDKRISQELVAWLRDATSLGLQAAIAEALGFTGDRRALDGALEMFASDEPGQQARARFARALGRVADRDDLPWATALSFGVNYRAETEVLASAAGGGIVTWD